MERSLNDNKKIKLIFNVHKWHPKIKELFTYNVLEIPHDSSCYKFSKNYLKFQTKWVPNLIHGVKIFNLDQSDENPFYGTLQTHQVMPF